MTTSTTIASQIRANVDAWYSNAIDHATFQARQRKLWSMATDAGFVDDVTALVAPTTCDMIVVGDALRTYGKGKTWSVWTTWRDLDLAAQLLDDAIGEQSADKLEEAYRNTVRARSFLETTP